VCGYAQISNGDIDTALANYLLPTLLFQAVEAGTVDQFLDQVLEVRIPGLQGIRSEVMSSIERSSCTLSDNSMWRRKCPNCGNTDSGVYRWQLINGRLEPTPDNIPLR
jgi:hypothetical protein